MPSVPPGKYFWRLTRNKHLVSLQPAQIHRFWRGLPLNLDSVDAVYERTSDHKIVFFKGESKRRRVPPVYSHAAWLCSCRHPRAHLLPAQVQVLPTPGQEAPGEGRQSVLQDMGEITLQPNLMEIYAF